MMTPVPALARLAASLALALVILPAHARTVPEGFEDLLDGQTEMLEISVFAASAGLSPVRVTLDSVQLLEPHQVLQALPLTAQARAALLPALSRPLPRNSHLACGQHVADPGCGYLEPPAAADGVRAIHDESEGVVHLFVARQWLPAADPAARFHRVSATAENAFLHQHTVNLSGGRGYQSIAAQGSAALGLFMRGHLAGQWHFTRQRYPRHGERHALRLDDAYYRHDLGWQHYLETGRIDRRDLSSPQGGNFAFSMLPLERFLGVRLGTTQAYLDTGAVARATPLTVLLARDARVDAFDGDRLLESFYLRAGVTTLDTRRFPYGAYTVTLRIHEDGVLVRSEQASFEKQGDWVGDRLEWFMQAGRRSAREADLQHRRSAAAGVRVPLRRAAALTAGMAEMDGGRTYGEARLDVRRAVATRDMSGSVSLLHGSNGSRGQQLLLAYRRRASWNLSRQRLRGSGCGPRPDARDRLGCETSVSASLALPWAGGEIYLGHTRRQAWGATVQTVADLGLPVAPMPPWLAPPILQRSRTGQVSYSRLGHWRGFSVAVRAGVWQQRTVGASDGRRDRGIHATLSLARLQRRPAGPFQQRYALDLRQPRHARPALGFTAGQLWRQERDDTRREASAELSGDNARYLGIGAGALLQNAFGRTGASVGHYRRPGRSDASYSATHSAALAATGRGIYWGSGTSSDAGLAVDVDAAEDPELDGIAAELQVAGLHRRRLRLGERRLFPLAAYRAHRTEVQDASVASAAASVRLAGIGGARSLFLPPGRLMRMPIPVQVTYTFVGKARDRDGGPVSGARILNAAVPGTGAQGGFLADFAQRESTLYLLQGQRVLQCPLQVRERRNVLLLVGEVRCDPLPATRLPLEIRQQARVGRLLREHGLIEAARPPAPPGDAP